MIERKPINKIREKKEKLCHGNKIAQNGLREGGKERERERERERDMSLVILLGIFPCFRSVLP